MKKPMKKRKKESLKSSLLTVIVGLLLVAGLSFYLFGGGMPTHPASAENDTSAPEATEVASTQAAESEPESEESPAPAVSVQPTQEPDSTPSPVPQTDVVAPANPAATAPVPTEEPPYLPLAGYIIGIDPGHQAHGNSQQEPIAPGSSQTKAKVSSGTAGVSTRIAEYVTVLDIGLQLRDALESLGATVVMTRETHDVDISNIERAQMMNEAGVALVLRLHCNGSENHDVKGLSLFCKATGEGAEESYAVAQALMTPLLEMTGAKDMGIHVNDNYTGQNWSTVPCVMVEMGFMSNPEEDVLLNTPEYQALLVEGMVRGIMDYLGLEYLEEDYPEPPEGIVLEE